MQTTMKAAVLHAPNDLRVEEIEMPKIADDEVLVKVSFCGICGSDIPRILVNGTYHFPTIPGHEFGGIVSKVSKAIEENLLGKKVAVIPLIPCHNCEMCEIGNFAQCHQYDFLGSRSDGGFAEYVKVPRKNLIVLSDEVDNMDVAFLEPVTVALHVIKNSGLTFGNNVAVFGLGAIGMFVAQWAKVFGATHVFAIDIDPKKVALAKKIGLEDAICSKDINVEEFIKNKTDGVDFAYEASGAAVAFKQAIKILRQSGILGLVGRPTRDMVIEPNIFEKILRAQLKVIGTWSFEMTEYPHNTWKESMNAIREGKIKVKPLVSHILPLERLNEAVNIMANHTEDFNKILIEPK